MLLGVKVIFEAYRLLKSLGYIIARHNVAWSLKCIRNSIKCVYLEGTEECKQLVDVVFKVEVSIDKLFGDLKINDLKPDFDVYLPSNRFRKLSPGDPNFLLYLSRGHLLSRTEIEALERQYGGVPLKTFLITEGKVSFYSFDKVELPVLPGTFGANPSFPLLADMKRKLRIVNENNKLAVETVSP